MTPHLIPDVRRRVAAGLGLVLFAALIGCGGDGSGGSTRDTANGNATVTPAPAGLDAVAWLLGGWRMEDGGTETFEEWRKGDGDVLLGRAVTIAEGSSVFTEQLRIEARNGTLVYIATISGQDPVEFICSSAAGGEIVFENPAHDYPQRIQYTQVTVDSMVARIDGSADGEVTSEEFQYVRVR